MGMGLYQYLINIDQENARRIQEINRKKRKHRCKQHLRFKPLPILP